MPCHSRFHSYTHTKLKYRHTKRGLIPGACRQATAGIFGSTVVSEGEVTLCSSTPARWGGVEGVRGCDVQISPAGLGGRSCVKFKFFVEKKTGAPA